MKRLEAMVCAMAVLGVCAVPASAVTINVARQGTATQSSLASGGVPERAIDGGLGTAFAYDATATHTDANPFNWWQVDLGAAMPIGQIDLHNRGDCCTPNRLGDFRVSVFDAPGGSVVYSEHYPGDVGIGNVATFNPPAGVAGQVVQVQIVGENGGANDGLNNAGNGILSLREVVVLGETTIPNGANVAALYGVAGQSSTLNNSYRPGAHRAIDGNTSGVFNNATVSHTNNELQPLWGVDLTAEVPVDHLRIYERTDSCCNGRLNSFSVTLYDAGMNTVFSQDVTSGVSTYLDIPVPYGADARYASVQMMDTGTARTLELAEVQVIGSEPGVRNVARNPKAVATQSSTRVGSGANVPSAAIDGNTDGRWSSNSTTHTTGAEPGWWQLDLGDSFNLEDIALWNRTDSCCVGRLSNFRVLALWDGTPTYSEDFFTGGGYVPPGDPFMLGLPENVVADTIRIELLGSAGRVLSLAEVQVWATPEPATLSLLGLGALALLRRRRG